ncbi:MAG TPA: SUF system NifU family Fe-S cluster assembly protein [Gemmatimonadales bacterium]|nr:SUF system NifU family Fe-S cluster assembly protein [Gemmatimonadales bacterium]
MTDLSDLYQQIIVEHNRAPRNFKKLAHPTRQAEGANPLCGDQISLEVELAGDRIADIGFQGSGCAISQAAASLLTGAVQGKSTADAQELFRQVHAMLTSPPGTPVDTAKLGKLAALAGVRQFPVRVKCASLPWHTLRAALESAAQPVSTE